MEPELLALEYIDKYRELGITNNAQIITKVREEADAIKAELKLVDEKRERLKKLIAVLFHLGDDSVRVKRRIVNVPSIKLDDNSPETIQKAIELRQKICEIIEMNHPISNRDLISKVGGYQEETIIYRAIKLLGERQIITRDKSEEKKILPGNKWNERGNLIK